MRAVLLGMSAMLAVTLVLVSPPHPAPVAAHEEAVEYAIDIDQKATSEVRNGTRFVTVQFRMKRTRDQALVTDIPKEEIVVEEDGQRVTTLDITQPKAQKLTVVLAMDISGS